MQPLYHVLILTPTNFSAAMPTSTSVLDWVLSSNGRVASDHGGCALSLLPADDDINHVLDYRKVRQIIIDECTAEHVNLLETLIGKLAHRLMQLPGVIGVRVKIAKLEIFDDCEVAIRMQSGQW